MTRLRRVLYLVNLDPAKKFGTLEEQLLSLARAFRSGGSVLLPVFAGRMGENEAAMYRTEQLPVEELDLRSFSFARLRRLLRLIRDNEIEVVHWNFYHPLNIYAVLTKIMRPSVSHFITDHISRTGEVVKPTSPFKCTVKGWAFQMYARVLCVSDYVLNDLSRQRVWKNLSRFHHFINTERFNVDQSVRVRVREQQGVGHCFVILVIAHLIPEKGVEVALKALRLLPAQVRMWIVGDGPQRPSLERHAKELQVEHQVTFCGLQSNVAPYMQAADCVVCPSLWGEAAGLVILEAMGCGLPVVASHVGGIPEFVEEGTTGYLFPAGDHETLAERVGRLVQCPERVQSMGAQARMTACKRFSVEVRLPEALRTYEV